MMLVLAPKSTEGIEENLLKTRDRKISPKSSKNHENEKEFYQLCAHSLPLWQ
jgi:hypothetical protein